MAHRFLHKKFGSGFVSEHAILTETPYQPEVLILGTYNPSDEELKGGRANQADFFYGRNYFWPVLHHLANPDQIPFAKRSSSNQPSLETVFELCRRFKLTFADIILDAGANQTDFSDKRLSQLVKQGTAKTNVSNIRAFVQNTPSIQFVYFTRSMRSDPQWHSLKHEIILALPENVQAGCLVSPSGNGLGKRFPDLASGAAGSVTTATLSRHWLWANETHPTAGQLARPDFVHFDHNWLRSVGVDPSLF